MIRPLLSASLLLVAATAPAADPPPASMQAKFAQGLEEVRATGIEQKALNVGDKAVDATLLTAGGDKVQLSSLWAKQPLVLTFYRGGWCPYCNQALGALQASIADFDAVGAKVVAVAPELPKHVAGTESNNHLTFQLLSDSGNQLAGKMGLAYRLPEVILPIYRDKLGLAKFNGDQEYTLPLAATYVIDTQGVIRWAFLESDYKKRAEPAEVLAAVKSLGDEALGDGAAPSDDLAMPQPTIPHQMLAREVGVWDAQMTMWMAPGAEPIKQTAVETNQMLGGFWLLSDYDCSDPPMPFRGQMQLGYDPEEGKYIGTWIDTMNPYLSRFEGSYDIATHELTLYSEGKDFRTGKMTYATLITKYIDENTKTFTMYEGKNGAKGWKMAESTYTRRK